MMKAFLEDMFWWLPIGTVPEVSALELKRKLAKTNKRPNLIDVRTVAEWNQGHLAKTLNIPVSLIKKQVNALPYEKDEPIVIICRTATRSIPAVRMLKMKGFTDVCQLKGGMIEWERKGYSVRKGK